MQEIHQNKVLPQKYWDYQIRYNKETKHLSLETNLLTRN